MPMSNTIGARVRQLREARGLSQQALEQKAGIARGYLSRLEAGSRGGRVSHAQLEAIAKAMDVSVVELQAGVAHPRPMDPCPNRTRAAALALEDGVPPAAVAHVMAMPVDVERSVLSWATEMLRTAGKQA